MNMIDREDKDKDLLALLTYLAEEDRPEKLFENQHLIKIPIVRNGGKAIISYHFRFVCTNIMENENDDCTIPVSSSLGKPCIYRAFSYFYEYFKPSEMGGFFAFVDRNYLIDRSREFCLGGIDNIVPCQCDQTVERTVLLSQLPKKRII